MFDLFSKPTHTQQTTRFRAINEKIVIPDELIDEIGEYLGFDMWNKRDITQIYDSIGCREPNAIMSDFFVKGNIVYFKDKIPLLVFQYIYNKSNHNNNNKSLFTLNLKTLKSTYNSPTQKLLSPELFDKIKKYTNPIIINKNGKFF